MRVPYGAASAPSGYVRKTAEFAPGMIMSTPVERKYATALFKNACSSSTLRSASKGTTSTRKRTIRRAAFRITVYGKTHRNLPASFVPPIHPYSSLTVWRKDSEA